MNKQPKESSSRYHRFYQKVGPAVEKVATHSYTSVVFSLLAVALFALYAILPTVKTILFLRREIADKTIVSRQMEDKITAIVEAQNTLDEISPQLTLVGQSVPADPQVLELSREIKNLASSLGASLSGIQAGGVAMTATAAARPNQPPPKIPIGTFNFSLVVNAPYGTLKKFMTELLALRRIVTIDSISFGANAGDTGSAIRMVLKATAYYFGQI